MRFCLKEEREKAHLSQAELSRKSKVSRSIINELENGKKSDCSTKTLTALADALGIHPAALLLR